MSPSTAIRLPPLCCARIRRSALTDRGLACQKYMVPEAEAAGCPDIRWYENREAVKEDLAALFTAILHLQVCPKIPRIF